MYPLISILIATYNPNIEWLKQQLESVNNQTYENIEVIILDDCSKFDIYQKIEKLSISMITKFPLQLLRNEVNIGSNKTFEKLTLLSKGEYLAYCDQDDIWYENKISMLYNEIIKDSNNLLVYSDMRIIDENNCIIEESFNDYKKRNKFYSGENLFHLFLYKNCISGCTILVKSDVAIQSVPFFQGMVHDHYIALFVSCLGNICFIDKPLISYRRHSKNQTSVLKNVYNKNDYETVQIDLFIKRISYLRLRTELFNNINFQKELEIAEKWAKSRKIWWSRFDIESLKTIIKLRNCNLERSFFEIMLARLPNSIFKFVSYIIKSKNI